MINNGGQMLSRSTTCDLFKKGLPRNHYYLGELWIYIRTWLLDGIVEEAAWPGSTFGLLLWLWTLGALLSLPKASQTLKAQYGLYLLRLLITLQLLAMTLQLTLV